MYKKLDLYRKPPGGGRPEMVAIGYWDTGVGPALVKDFTYIDERGFTTAFRNANVIGQKLEDVVRDQKVCGFEH